MRFLLLITSFRKSLFSSMSTEMSPMLLLTAAIMIGAGLFVVQRSRVFMPEIFRRIPFFQRHRRAAGYMFLVILTLGVVMGGYGCRILYFYFRS